MLQWVKINRNVSKSDYHMAYFPSLPNSYQSKQVSIKQSLSNKNNVLTTLNIHERTRSKDETSQRSTMISWVKINDV